MSDIFHELFAIIEERKQSMPKGSYTANLLENAPEKIWRKLNEETLEVILGSARGDRDNLVYEAADLLYHLIVLLSYHDIDFREVELELDRRKK